jgi:hypothetical protein
MKQTLYDILFIHDWRPVGLLLSIVMLIWGGVLLAPGSTFLLSAVYAPMYSYFPTVWSAEITWGLAYLIVGLMSLYCLTGTRLKIYHYSLLLGIFLFTFTAISFFRASFVAIGPWLHSLFALTLFWRYIRRSQQI